MGRLVDYTNTRPAPALVGNEEIILRSGAGASIKTTTQGIADLATVDVNTTLFVDPVNGSASGVRGDMKRPFNTLAAAQAAASSGDTFVFQPGNAGGGAVGGGVTFNYIGLPGSIFQALATATGTINVYGDGAVQADVNHATGNINLFNCRNVTSMNITGAGTIKLYGANNVAVINLPVAVVPTFENYGTLTLTTTWSLAQPLTIDNKGILLSIPAFHASLTIAGPGLAIDDTNNQARINSTLVVQQHGGTPGTDEVQISHSGTYGLVNAMSGTLRLNGAGGSYLQAAGANVLIATGSGVVCYQDFSPGGAVTLDLGNTTNRWKDIILGQKVEWLQSADQGAATSNSAYIQAEDISGTAELIGEDEAGNRTQLTPHAKDAPEELYDIGAGADKISRSINRYRGVITWVQDDRKDKILDAQSQGLEVPRLGKIRIEETFAEYNARTGKSLKVEDWDAVQTRNQSNYDKDVAERETERAEHQKRKDTVLARKASIEAYKPIVAKNAILADLDAKIEAEEDEDEKASLQAKRDEVAARNFITEKNERLAKVDQELSNIDKEEPEVLPAKNIKKPKPQWLS